MFPQEALSYDVMGVREEFADWISNISPFDTPFVSLTGKAPINNTLFEWQYDRLKQASDNFHGENDIPDPVLFPTVPVTNITQILRKVVQVSDTVEALDIHGKVESEAEYQVSKASKEIKRDLEKTFLSRQKRSDINGVRKTDCFYELVSPLGAVDPETGGVTHFKLNQFTFQLEDLWKVTEGLYMAGARANVIMYHPVHAETMSQLLDSHGDKAVQKWDSEAHEFNQATTRITDPLGQEFYLLPNVLCDRYMLYFFHPHDWFQRVLRPPSVVPLDKEGSYERWMIEMEVGLQHRNPWASGILELEPDTEVKVSNKSFDIKNTSPQYVGIVATGDSVNSIDYSSSDDSIATIDPNGKITPKRSGTIVITSTVNFAIASPKTVTSTIKIVNIPTSVTLTLPPDEWIHTAKPLKATYSYVGDTPDSVTWDVKTTTGQSTSIVQIAPDGTMDLNQSGQVNIKVILHYGSKTVSSTAKLYKSLPTTVEITNREVVVAKGKTLDLKQFVRFEPAEANTSNPPQAATYTFQDPAEPDITKSGSVVTGVLTTTKPAIVIVSPTANPTDTDVIRVTVQDGEKYIHYPTSVPSIKVGETKTITLKHDPLAVTVVMTVGVEDASFATAPTNATRVDTTTSTIAVTGKKKGTAIVGVTMQYSATEKAHIRFEVPIIP